MGIGKRILGSGSVIAYARYISNSNKVNAVCTMFNSKQGIGIVGGRPTKPYFLKEAFSCKTDQLHWQYGAHT